MLHPHDDAAGRPPTGTPPKRQRRHGAPKTRDVVSSLVLARRGLFDHCAAAADLPVCFSDTVSSDLLEVMIAGPGRQRECTRCRCTAQLAEIASYCARLKASSLVGRIDAAFERKRAAAKVPAN